MHLLAFHTGAIKIKLQETVALLFQAMPCDISPYSAAKSSN